VAFDKLQNHYINLNFAKLI